MMVEDFDEMERRWDGPQSKGRPKAAARPRAREIVEQTNWLWRPLIYWDGVGRSGDSSVVASCRPLAQIVAEKLASRPSGLYFVNTGGSGDSLRRPSVLSVVSEILLVDSQLLAGISYQAFVASRRFPRVLPTLVGDVSRWRADVTARLSRVRAALEASRVLADQGPETLVLEGNCLWLGSEARRPSCLLGTETIRDWLTQTNGETGPGQVLGAVVLGQRNTGRSLPPNLRSWRNIGQMLADWPPDLVAAIPSVDLNRVQKAAHACTRLNSSEARHAAVDYRLTSLDASLVALLAALPPFLESLQQYHLEPQRRWGKLVQHVTLAFDRAPVIGLSQGFADVLRETGEDRGLDLPTEGNFLVALDFACRWFLGYELPSEITAELSRRIDKVGRHFRIEGLRRVIDQWTPAIPSDYADAVWSACREAVMQSLVELREMPTGDKSWALIAGALAGRLAAQGDPRRSMVALASWLDHCRATWPPAGEFGALRLACTGFSEGVAASESAEDLTRFLDALSHHGSTLLEKEVVAAWSKNGTGITAVPSPATLAEGLSSKFAVLGQLGLLTRQQAEQVITGSLCNVIDNFLPGNRSVLPGFLDWLRSNPRASAWVWVDIFLLETPGLASVLTQWVQRLVHGGLFSLQSTKELWQSAEELIRYLWWRLLRYGGETERRERQTFLLRSFWVVERLLPETDQLSTEVRELFVRRLRLVEIAYHWKRKGYRNLEGLLDALLSFCRSQEAKGQEKTPWNEESLSGDELALAIELANGRVEQLLALLEHLDPEWKHPEDPQAGWRFLAGWPGAQAFLSSCTGRAEYIPRVFRLLKRLALVARLPVRDFFDERMQTWQSPPARPRLLDFEVPAAFAVQLERLRAYREMAGHATPFPDAVECVLSRPADLQREREVLERREREEGISSSARLRLGKLRGLQDNPERLARWVERDLTALVVEQEQAARLEAIEAITRTAIRRHWESILGSINEDLESPDWDNALRLWYAVEQNRRLLKQLLQHEARGDREWIRNRPVNRAFVERLRRQNLRPEAWLGPTERQYPACGELWTVRVETDPLKVLWMGRLFGTCLSPGEFNSYSTVANAVEVNKRVLYLHDGKCRIIGRKLLAMNHEGVVFGFRSYGSRGQDEQSGGSPWVKLLFDVFCLDLVLRTGARLPTSEEEQRSSTEEGLKRFRLFAGWYFDGYEPFDAWVKELVSVADASPEGLHQALGASIARRLREKGVEFARDNGETLRALLWLGPAAEPIIREAVAQGALTQEQLGFLAEHAQGVKHTVTRQAR
jgi:hypothetical protein